LVPRGFSAFLFMKIDLYTLHPHYVEAYIGKGNVFGEYKQYEEALATYEQAIHIDPVGPEVAGSYNNKAQILYRMGRDAEALAAAEQALRLDPELAAAYQNKGWILERLERLAEAQQAYDKAKALGWYQK
jgi:tetratricopeptide (TPR) repeat protein